MRVWTRSEEERVELMPADIESIISLKRAGGYGLDRAVSYERARETRAGLDFRALGTARCRAGLGR